LNSLRASEERARAAFEQDADAIFLGNSEGQCIAVNESSLELTGYSREEFLNQHIGMLFSADVHRQQPLRFDRVESGERVINERLLTRKDGTQIPVEMHTKKPSDGTLQSIMRDLTYRKRLEEQLQLRQRMDSVGTLTSGIAHDFNNILAGIMGYASLLAERSANLGPQQLEYLANISQATQRGADLVNSLKSLSHPAPSTGNQFDLFDVSSEVMRVLSVTTDRVIQKHLRVGLRGEQVYAELVSIQPDITVVVSTGDVMIPAEAFAGAHHILQKPYRPSRLSAVIRQALDGRGTRPAT
jgi:PAS domain S-box-containing protein